VSAQPRISSDARPLWKRWALGIRDRAYRTASAVERRYSSSEAGLLPPLHLRVTYYRTWDRAAFHAACAAARLEVLDAGLEPGHRVLDIGCGIGNLAIGLTECLTGEYDGVDVSREAIDWCRSAISPRFPSFRFHHADVSNGAYSPDGLTPASAYTFPFVDGSFDFVFLGSVFTHLMPDEVENYLREIGRLLRPGGRAVASYFLLNDETRVGVDEARSFIPFAVRHPSGLCRLHDVRRPEAAVALDEAFVMGLHDRAQLRLRSIRRGRWWTGASHDQDVMVVEKGRT
jgi:SAM-dependent methyltransferase